MNFGIKIDRTLEKRIGYSKFQSCADKVSGISTARDFWQAKGPSEILDRLQRGDMGIEAAALALGVNPANLAAYVADIGEKDYDNLPIEVDPALKVRARTYMASTSPITGKPAKRTDKLQNPSKKVVVSSLIDEDPIPASVITQEKPPQPATSGKWPSIRVASLESLQRNDAPSPSPTASPSPSPSPSQLMKNRPDLTIVARTTKGDT